MAGRFKIVPLVCVPEQAIQMQNLFCGQSVVWHTERDRTHA